MKVKELIKQLLDCPLDSDVRMCTNKNKGFDVTGISYSAITGTVWIKE